MVTQISPGSSRSVTIGPSLMEARMTNSNLSRVVRRLAPVAQYVVYALVLLALLRGYLGPSSFKAIGLWVMAALLLAAVLFVPAARKP